MKNKFKSQLVYCILCMAAIATLGSCVKSRSGETDFSNLKPIVTIVEGGLAKFSSQALTFPGTDSTDTLYFRLNYAAKTVAPTDIVVTIGYDDAALATYNTTAASPYTKFPDSIYTFTTTTVTIKAGQSYSDLIPMVVYPSKVDPTKNYMFPISITDASGNTISGNFGTIYYHFIGNPIAGAYEQEWIRYNAADSLPADLVYDLDLGSTIFAPSDPTTIQVESGSAGLIYVLNFTNTNGVLSNFNLSFDPASVTAAATAASPVTVTGGPVIETADPVAGLFRFYFTYNNASGSPRVIMDQFVKQ